jgi:DNA-binding transcriptional LysR family regulator
MSAAGTPTFDQLAIFLAVVESGSFAAAGRRLNRATSVISYGIDNLETQLGVALFERAGTRRPRLTEPGRAVLAEARAIAQGVDGLRAKVNGLRDGLEAEIGLVVDVMLPSQTLAEVLRDFASRFPTVALRLHVEALGAVSHLVLERRAAIGVAGPLASELPGLDCLALAPVLLVPVAAPAHPLARAANPRPGLGREHVQLVLSDRSPLTEGRDFSVVSPHTWRLADLGAKHALLREGIGWGNMPLPMVADDLAAGRLVRLELPDHPGVAYPLSAIYRSDTPPGPAASWLLHRFSEAAQR